MKRILTRLAPLFLLLPLFTSCSETQEEGDHANWKQRNTDFMAAWADSCDAYMGQGVDVDNAAQGQMFRLLSYKLDPTKQWNRQEDYVYCRVLAKGNGTQSPMYTDSIRMNFRVRLMPSGDYPEGQVVDQSYKTDQMDPAVNIPSSYVVSGLIEGVSTALMRMRTGDRWLLYIPYQLGYGTTEKTSIPACSSLVFDINLTEIAQTGQELSIR